MDKKIISFNESEYNKQIKFLEKGFVPKLEQVIDAYNALDIDKFDQKCYQLLSSGKLLDSANAKYESLVIEDVPKTKTTALKKLALSTVQDELQPLSDAIEELFEVNYRIENSLHSFRPKEFNWQCCIIKNGKAVIQEHLIRDQCSISLINDKQEDFYNRLTRLEEEYNGIVQIMNKEGIAFGPFGDVKKLLFQENHDHTISLMPEVFKNILQ